MPTDPMTMSTNRSRRRAGVSAIVASAAIVVVGCDLGVFDPGTIEHDDLFQPQSIQPLIVGAERNFGRAITAGTGPHGGVFGAGAYLTDEVVHSGQWVGLRDWNNAVHVPNDVAETATRWSHAQNARVTAENAGDIIRTILEAQGENPDADAHMARAHLWAAFSSRVLGDAFCSAVIDGGPEEPVTAFYHHAEAHFDDVIRIAGAAGDADLVTAAHAGRAQVRMMLGNWNGAVADAGQVPTGFAHEVRLSSNSPTENNGLHNAFMQEGQATIWGTPFSEWGTDLSGVEEGEGDPRIPYFSRGSGGQPVIGGDGRRETWTPSKYTSRDDNIRIAGGTEMRLIEAEAALLDGDAEGALAGINAVRSHHGLAAVDGGSEAEAWFLLQKERGIELYAEGRRLPDLRRWSVTPGHAGFDVVRIEAPGDQPVENDEVRNVLDNPMGELCLPMNIDERNSNPNL